MKCPRWARGRDGDHGAHPGGTRANEFALRQGLRQLGRRLVQVAGIDRFRL